MLPANVILTNSLINSSEAKDKSKVMQLYYKYMGEYERNIEMTERC